LGYWLFGRILDHQTNGLAAYIWDVTGRTEQYWCPIKHARRVLHAHPYYNGFVDYGGAEAYQRELQGLRTALTQINAVDSNGAKGNGNDPGK
jgi:hypothetical protein